MSKKKKKSEPTNKNEFAEQKISDSLSQESDLSNQENNSSEKDQKTDFMKELEAAVQDLWYMSETDAEITVFSGQTADSVSKEILTAQAGISSETNIEEKTSADFFKNLTAMQDWFGEEEKETAEKFSALEKLLEENLKDLKVFKVGQIEIDIYVVGLDENSVLTGVKTKAVET